MSIEPIIEEGTLVMNKKWDGGEGSDDEGRNM